MERALIYNGTITAEQFLFYEIRIASKYYLDGTSVEDAIEEIKKNNLFQYPTERLVARMVRSCYKRLDALDDEQLRQELSSAPAEIAKQINLYAMMRYNRIVWDFMVGVIGEKFRSQDFEFSRKDLNVFFSHLQEQNDDIAGWSESTVNKIKQVLTKILVEVEILDTFKSTRLNPLFLCEELEEGIRRNSISVNDSMDVLVDGNPTRSTVERNAILNTTPKASVAIQYNDLLNMKKDERRELVAGKDVIYIYHNSIDAIGDKAPTESKVFDACETAIQELSGILRIIVNELSGTNIFITADHGFLYTYKPLSESDKIDRKAFSGNVYELGRRYALTAPDTTADFLLPVNLERELDGTPIKGYAPQDTIRMKVQGGGENYVHGGISLQELVVPVIAFKNLRTSNKNYVEVKNAELKLLSESRKISNLIFSLEFHQRQPVGDKIQPCTYSIYMTDDEGVVISDRQTVIADKTSDNAADRVFRVRFNLKAGTYDKKKVYRLVIANEIDVEEIEFHIDIAFADDFGFDL